MKHIKKFESYTQAPQIDDVIESSYKNHTSAGVTDKEELFNLIFTDAKKELAYGISLFVKSGMGSQIEENIKSKIVSYLKDK